MEVVKLNKDPMERFVDNIDVLPNSCWQWRKSLVSAGYGYFSVRGDAIYAHRFAYKIFKGEIPSGKHLDHLCRNRGCVNPEHLQVVSPRENILRGLGPTANFARRTECAKGHPLGGDNGYFRKGKPGRECKTCRSEASHKGYIKRRMLNVG